MNWTKASAIAEILSSIAILVTLAYLTVEIHQNTATLQATSRQAVLEAEVTHLGHVIADPRLWLNQLNPNMTDAEKVQLSAYLISLMRNLEFSWFQYQSGALDATTWEAYEGIIAGTLSYSESRKWWGFYDSTSAFDPNFTAHVNQLIQGEPIFERLEDLQAFD